MYVVLDSNVWIAELGLRSSLGAAVRFYRKQHGATLVIPEVVRLESERNLRNLLAEHVASIHRSHNSLLSVFGSLREVVLPTAEDIDHVVNSLFSEIGIPFEDVGFSLESARSSFLKTIDKVAPSDKSQQFKDGVLWADCVNLLRNDDVHLVTEDKAFFEGRDYRQGLARQLADEISTASHALSLHPKLQDLLNVIHAPVNISAVELLQGFLNSYGESVNRMLQRMGFSLGEVSSESIRPFATEDPGLLYVEFELVVECNPAVDDGRQDGKLLLRGDAQLQIDSGEYTDLRNFGEEFSFTAADGSEEKSKNQVLFADSAIIGHRVVHHSIRHRLD